MKADIYNAENAKVGSLDLPEELFGAPWRPQLVEQVLSAQLANERRPWAHAKGRGEVSGGGKKPWRQKGTGRARHGSTRSPLWRHGGKAHGPLSTRDYSEKVNKKMKLAAVASVLSKKLKDQEIKVLDSLVLKEPKTKLASDILRRIMSTPKQSKKLDVLLVPASDNKNILRAARNLVKTKILPADSLNVYDLLNYRYVIFEEGAVPKVRKPAKTKAK